MIQFQFYCVCAIENNVGVVDIVVFHDTILLTILLCVVLRIGLCVYKHALFMNNFKKFWY